MFNLKSTGIIRRVDDLGRIVLPKEIRRSLEITDGDPLEIYFYDKEYLVLKKYSPIPEYEDRLKSLKNDILDDDIPNKMLFIRMIDDLIIALNRKGGADNE